MQPKLITMLTYNDVTIKDALSTFEECADLPCVFWGFKDIGLEKDQMKHLVSRMKEKGKTTFLEVVSLTEDKCMDGAKLAVECQFDYLMGTVYFESVHDYLMNQEIKYLPFPGKISGHPSVLEGTIEEIIEDGKRLEKHRVEGFDLLAYRFIGDPEKLADEFIHNTQLPVVIAGSISSFERLDKIKELDPWAFTIGSAFFDRKFVPGGSFAQQIESVINYIRE